MLISKQITTLVLINLFVVDSLHAIIEKHYEHTVELQLARIFRFTPSKSFSCHVLQTRYAIWLKSSVDP